MATGKGTVGLGNFVGAAAENLVHDIEREIIGGHRHDVHCGDGFTAHGVDVGERIGGRDLPEKIGVIDNGREEIEGLNEGEVVGQTVDRSVIGAGRADEEIGVVDVAEATQDLREFRLAELGGSSSARGEFGEAFDIFTRHGLEGSWFLGFENTFSLRKAGSNSFASCRTTIPTTSKDCQKRRVSHFPGLG